MRLYQMLRYFCNRTLCFVGVGLIGVAIFGIWAIIDAFSIHKWIAAYNNKLIDDMNKA